MIWIEIDVVLVATVRVVMLEKRLLGSWR